MASNGSSAGSVFAAFVLGAATGAALALLFAPASGEETRRKLGEMPARAANGPNRSPVRGATSSIGSATT